LNAARIEARFERSAPQRPWSYRSRSRPDAASGWQLYHPIKDSADFINSEVALPREPGAKGGPHRGQKAATTAGKGAAIHGNPLLGLGATREQIA
jgi:hypothetical protein